MLKIDRNTGNINEKEILIRWQKSLSILLLSIIFIVFICEVGFLIYFLNYSPETLASGTDGYIIKYILYPTICNLGVFAVWQFTLLRDHSRETQAWITMIGFILILSNILRTHYVFPATYPILMVPLVLTVFYGSRRITNTTAAMAMCVYVTTMMSIYFTSKDNLPEMYLNNAVIGFVMIPLSALLVNSIIDREHEEQQLILLDPHSASNHNAVLKDERYDLLNGEGILAKLKSACVKHERCAFVLLFIDDYQKNETDEEEILNDLLRNAYSALDYAARYDEGHFALLLLNPDEEELSLRLESIKLEFDRAMMKKGCAGTMSITVQIVDEDFDTGHILATAGELLNTAALKGGDLILSSRK